MRVGDLVKHPQGMINVNPEMYSLGIVLKMEQHTLSGLTILQCHVLWPDCYGAMVYSSEALEVISESR